MFLEVYIFLVQLSSCAEVWKILEKMTSMLRISPAFIPGALGLADSTVMIAAEVLC